MTLPNIYMQLNNSVVSFNFNIYKFNELTDETNTLLTTTKSSIGKSFTILIN